MNADSGANNSPFSLAPDGKEQASLEPYVLQQAPLDLDWVRANCEVYDLVPIAIPLNHRVDAFPSLAALTEGDTAYKAVLNSSLSSSKQTAKELKLASKNIEPLLFAEEFNLYLDLLWAGSIRDYARAKTRDPDYYTNNCLRGRPRVPGSIFGLEANSLDNILSFLKLCRPSGGSKADAHLPGIANQLLSMVAIQAWHVINGRYLLYNPAAGIKQGECKIPASGVLFDHSKTPTLMMSFRQRDFALHPALAERVRAAFKRKQTAKAAASNEDSDGEYETKTKAKNKSKSRSKSAASASSFDATVLHVAESDLQAIARRTSLSTFIFLVNRCVASIANTAELKNAFGLQDAFKWCRDQLGKNISLFMDTMKFREMPVVETADLFNNFVRVFYGDNNTNGRLLTHEDVRYCRLRNQASLRTKPLDFPDEKRNPFASLVPQFFFHLFQSPRDAVLPVPPAASEKALLGTFLWAIAVHTGSTMRADVLKMVRDAAGGDGDVGNTMSAAETKSDGKEAKKGTKRPRTARNEDARTSKRQRVGKKGAQPAFQAGRKTGHTPLLGTLYFDYRPRVNIIRRRYCFVIGPDQVLYASPPATFFVDDPISAGIFADELSVYQLTTTIVHCLTLQGTSQQQKFASEMTSVLESKQVYPPHYVKFMKDLRDVHQGHVTMYLALSSVLQWEADVIATLFDMAQCSMSDFCAFLMNSYDVYLNELNERLTAYDAAISGLFIRLHGIMRSQWSRVSHIPLTALRSPIYESSGLGFGILQLSAMAKYVTARRDELGLVFLFDGESLTNTERGGELARLHPKHTAARDDLPGQLAMALVNRHLPSSDQLHAISAWKVGSSGSYQRHATAAEFFEQELERTHVELVIPCLEYISIRCPPPVIMHCSTSSTKIAFGALPSPQVHNATQSAMMELSTEFAAAYSELLSGPDFAQHVQAMDSVPDRWKPALKFLHLSTPMAQRTPQLHQDIDRLMGNFGRNPMEIGMQQLTSKKELTSGTVRYVSDIPFFSISKESKYQPSNAAVLVDGALLQQLCQQNPETKAFWQSLQSFISSMMDTRRVSNAPAPRVISLAVIEAASVRLAADIEVPIGYTLRPPSERMMDILQFLWLAIPSQPAKTEFLKILTDTLAMRKDPRVNGSQELQAFFHKLIPKLADLKAHKPGSNTQDRKQASTVPMVIASSSSLVHPRAVAAMEISSSSSSAALPAPHLSTSDLLAVLAANANSDGNSNSNNSNSAVVPMRDADELQQAQNVDGNDDGTYDDLL